ncbi:ATP-binding protein [Actinomadura sp. WMMA1423]|uniref:ATP-binding protein n=1 Tax=Actinomadura sp. WMMA1423 TaxID=2591108 RepID=UPI0011467617|nr:ATP-binding protein [Actinomadura sp. WMMA1423]
MNDQRPVLQIPEPGEIQMTVQGEEASVRLVRELVRYALINWSYGRVLVDDSAVVMSEIITNAVNAAKGHELSIRIAVHEGAPLLECWDPSPELPRACEAGLDALSGRGMAIIAAYAKDTGVRPSPTGQGKVVWALMPTNDPGPAEPSQHPTPP